MIGIYRITNKINGKTYVGQSIDIKRRFWDHRCLSHEHNIHLKRAMMKYGKENFEYEILEECSIEELDEKERKYIADLKPEYNVSSGGNGKGKFPESVKKIISQKSKAQWERMTDEEKAQRVKNNLKGPRKGHIVSAETRQKLRERNLNKKQSLDTINKRKNTMLLKKQNGYIRTNEFCKKKVVCIETNETFESVKAAAEKINASPTSVSSMLKGRQKTVKGFHFKYLKV